jgi:hypothetical protein
MTANVRQECEPHMKCASHDFDHHGDPDVMSLREVSVPELVLGSDLDPRISYSPVINKKRLFARTANLYPKVICLVVCIKELLSAPGML